MGKAEKSAEPVGEVAVERRMRDPVVGSERPQRLPDRPPAKQLRIRNISCAMGYQKVRSLRLF
jgi:hypothetical protein